MSENEKIKDVIFYEKITYSYYSAYKGTENLHELWNSIKFAAFFGRNGALFMHFVLTIGNCIPPHPTSAK